jgi:hypothetical protein
VTPSPAHIEFDYDHLERPLRTPTTPPPQVYLSGGGTLEDLEVAPELLFCGLAKILKCQRPGISTIESHYTEHFLRICAAGDGRTKSADNTSADAILPRSPSTPRPSAMVNGMPAAARDLGAGRLHCASAGVRLAMLAAALGEKAA